MQDVLESSGALIEPTSALEHGETHSRPCSKPGKLVYLLEGSQTVCAMHHTMTGAKFRLECACRHIAAPTSCINVLHAM